MANRGLWRLTRHDLLELLIQQEQENEALRARVSELEEKVKNRSIKMEKAGSMAEAALSLNGIFEAADEAVAQYIENVRRRSEEQESICDMLISAAEQKAARIIEAAERERNRQRQSGAVPPGSAAEEKRERQQNER